MGARFQRDYDRRLNVAMIGMGHHAYQTLLPALAFLPVRLIALCNTSDSPEARATAAQYGCRHYTDTAVMYDRERLDAVLICVGPERHPDLVMQALDAGVHVWVEKPIAVSSTDLEPIFDHRGNRVVVIGYKKAFMPGTRKAVHVIDSREYGQLNSIVATYPVAPPPLAPGAVGDDWLNNSPHPLSVLIAAGGTVESVLLVTGSRHDGVAVLTFSNGVIGTLHMGSDSPARHERYEFCGDDWNLVIDNVTQVTLRRGIGQPHRGRTSFTALGDDTAALTWEPQNCRSTWDNKAEFTQGIHQELQYFCECVLEGARPTIASLEFALHVARVREAIAESRGSTVDVG